MRLNYKSESSEAGKSCCQSRLELPVCEPLAHHKAQLRSGSAGSSLTTSEVTSVSGSFASPTPNHIF